LTHCGDPVPPPPASTSELVDCPKCGYRRDPEAERCANCGARWPRAWAWQPAFMPMPPLGCIALLAEGGLCALMFLFGNRLAPSGTGTSDAGMAFQACSHAENFVRDRLVAPSTAKFQINCFWDQRATREANGDWSAIGTVDSQNSFGAMIRAAYVVDLSNAGGSSQLVDIRTYP
jgi:hypothetical protein